MFRLFLADDASPATAKRIDDFSVLLADDFSFEDFEAESGEHDQREAVEAALMAANFLKKGVLPASADELSVLAETAVRRILQREQHAALRP